MIAAMESGSFSLSHHSSLRLIRAFSILLLGRIVRDLPALYNASRRRRSETRGFGRTKKGENSYVT